MEINPEDVAQLTNSHICKGCKKEIEKGAKRCHHCGEYQALWRVLLMVLPPIVAFITIVILFGQLYISRQQLTETKAKRFEASEVLKEVQQVKVKAESVLSTAGDALEKSESVLSDAKTQVSQVSGEVKDIKQKVQRADKSLNTFTNRQNKLSEDVDKIKTELTAEVNKLKERNEIISLADLAISNGDAASYEELVRRAKGLKESDRLYNIVLSSILRVKEFYLLITRVGQTDIWVNKSDGTKVKNEQLTTEQLIKTFLGNPKAQWAWRTKAANLLGRKKEKGVPDILIRYMSDESLDVRRACIVSFGILTGYHNVDAFDYDKLIEWWSEHKEEWENKLPKK